MNRRRVDLTWIDEVSLALVGAAVSGGQDVCLVFPAMATDVGVLLAAQVLVAGFVRTRQLTGCTVGLVSRDTFGAVQRWGHLQIANGGDAVPLSEVFPLFRADPSSGDPGMRQGNRCGIVIGRTARGDWPVELLVVDHMSGEVSVDWSRSAVHLFSDPFAPELEKLRADGALIWGWPDGLIETWHDLLEAPTPNSADFSVGAGKLKALATGQQWRTVSVSAPRSSRLLSNLYEDMIELHRAAVRTHQKAVGAGLRRAWVSTATLAGLPCRPSVYDQVCSENRFGPPPTGEFAAEIDSWSSSLSEEAADYASIVALDILDLRAALEEEQPFVGALSALAEEPQSRDWLLVLRNRTAAEALGRELGQSLDFGHPRIGTLPLTWYSRVPRHDAARIAVVVGAPPKVGWQRLAGLATEMRVFVLGACDAARAKRDCESFLARRERWGSLAERRRTWNGLSLGPEPAQYEAPPSTHEFVVETSESADEPQPRPSVFAELDSLALDDSPLLSDSPVKGRVAVADESGTWRASVSAVEVVTALGTLLLDASKDVDVLDQQEPRRVPTVELAPGMRLIIGRDSGRAGLVDALEEKLKDRPDLLVAHHLAEDWRDGIHRAFTRSGMSVARLQHVLANMGCDKHPVTIASWVTPGGPMGPRDEPDVRILSEVLDAETAKPHLVHAALTRIRTFRRLAGKALAKAARGVAAAEDELVDEELGLSTADLREAIVIAEVLSVNAHFGEARVSEIGRIGGAQ